MKKWLLKTLVLAVFFAVAFAASAEGIISAPYVRRAPVVDGVLDDDAWKIAEEKGGTGKIAYLLNAVPISDGWTSDVWICWDDDFLYVAFKNYQPKNTVVAVSVNDGDPLWTNDDENEIFISTTYPGSRPYYQAIMNPLGAKSGLNGNLDWDVAAEIYDEYWVVEVAIPFYIFDNYYPEIGDEWSINLTRRSHAHAGGNGEWRCWSDLVVNTFLDPLTFGLLEFVQ